MTRGRDMYNPTGQPRLGIERPWPSWWNEEGKRMSDKPWEDPKNTGREAVLGRLVEKQTADIERLERKILEMHGKIDDIMKICEK